MQTYGLTEAGPGGLYLAEEYALAKLGSIGNRAAGHGTEFRVLRDDGTEAGPDETGELVLRGPAVMAGYFEDDTGTAAAFTGDGWLRSGDLVRVDAEGFVFHLDRLKDIIVRGGFNVASAEVEAVLLEHPDVLEAAVVGRPHERLGEDVHAVVVPRSGATVDVDALLAHCRSALADYKLPRTVEVRTEALPRNASGKVLKRELRAASA
jgi:acyl-CoA synthetase (AMP-forming)/AMP-acid ligase II